MLTTYTVAFAANVRVDEGSRSRFVYDVRRGRIRAVAFASRSVASRRNALRAAFSASGLD